jgi:hypothetical protein
MNEIQQLPTEVKKNSLPEQKQEKVLTLFTKHLAENEESKANIDGEKRIEMSNQDFDERAHMKPLVRKGAEKITALYHENHSFKRQRPTALGILAATEGDRARMAQDISGLKGELRVETAKQVKEITESVARTREDYVAKTKLKEAEASIAKIAMENEIYTRKINSLLAENEKMKTLNENLKDLLTKKGCCCCNQQ